MLLVGDSVAMVVHGHDTTLPVTMDEMLLHCKAVARGARRPFLVGDMPFGSFEASPQQVSGSGVLLPAPSREEWGRCAAASPQHGGVGRHRWRLLPCSLRVCWAGSFAATPLERCSRWSMQHGVADPAPGLTSLVTVWGGGPAAKLTHVRQVSTCAALPPPLSPFFLSW